MKEIIFWIVIVAMILIAGCAVLQKPKGANLPPPPPADGALEWIRNAGIVGIGIVVFFALWNSTKIYIAGIFGIGASMGLAVTCRYHEKHFALLAFILLGAGLLLVAISLFVKHKGLFLDWRKKK